MPESMTMREAARRLGVSNTKIWRMVKEGVLPIQKNPLDGRERLFRLSDVQKFQEQLYGAPHFVSDGSVNVATAPRAAELEEHVRPSIT